MKNFFVCLCLFCLCSACAYAVAPKIYINPGHGGYNSNDRNIVTINHSAGDHDGFWESQANLTKGLYLRDMLQTAGATVYMSRTDNRSGYRDDKSISNTIGDRPLSTIAREASGKADFFLSIHSNAGGNTTTIAVNYLLLMLTGTAGSSDWGSSFKYSEAVTAANAAWTRLADNPLTAWTSTTKRIMSYTTYTVISPSYLTIPGYLSEGEFHDYKPETHRLLNNDYCKLEAYRFLQAFCDYYSSSLTRPTTGVICGDVRDATSKMTSTTLYQKAKEGTKDEYTPLNGAKVKLKDSAGNVMATYICDNEYNGFYAFWDLPPGTYTVQCAATGHASVTNTVTVSAATITYNNVRLASGSGDGMEDIILEPIGILYDTLINYTPTQWLNSEIIRRAVVKDDDIYVLTDDSKIHIVDATNGSEKGLINTTGISGTEKNIGDIVLTDDNTLLACTQEHTVSGGTVNWKVYKWADNNSAPVLLFQNASSASLYDASVGRSIAVRGNLSNLKAFTIAYSLQSTGLRLLQYSWNGTTVTALRNNNTSGNTLGDATVWGDVELMKSPYSNSQFLINSATIYPTMIDVVQTDGSVFSKNEITTLQQATYGGTFVTYNNHILYITPYGVDNLGVGIYEATNGLGSASLIKTLYPETELSLASAGYMTAAAQTDGDELVVTLFVQNRGIDRWRLSQTDMEVHDEVITPIIDIAEGKDPKREFRSGWISTSWALDWPITMGTSASVVSTQKNNMDALLDKMQSARMNAVFFQVRGMSDAMYDSQYEPWSKSVTGTRGRAPSYDPLSYAIDQAHSRGMELHAWINPLRYSSSAGTYSNSLANDLAKTHNDWLLYYGDGTPDTVILNPGIPAVRQYIVNIVLDIINHYDVDGVVFDDYFYVNGKTTDAMDAAAFAAYNPDNLSRADWRRQNVNKMIEAVNTAIKNVKPWVRFGVAPPGVAATETAVANKYGVTRSPAPSGYDWQYNGQYSEPVQWLKDQNIDYISPQVYWRIGHSTNDYEALSAWWVQVANQFSRHAYISQSYSAVNGASNSSEMADEINANRAAATANSTFTGSALFRMGQVSDAFVSKLTAAYTEQALPPAMTWYSAPDLSAPNDISLNGKMLTWQHPNAVRFSVYAYPKGANKSQALESSAYLLGISYSKSFDLSDVVNLSDKTIAVCALDRYGNEHEAALYNDATTPSLSGMQGADIYASELTMAYSNGVYTFSYRLNEDATDITLQLLYEGSLIQSKSFGAQEKGVRSITLDESEIIFPERNTDEYLTWAIKATARPINALTKLSDDATEFQFYRPFGVAVDNNPESEYFGRIYVTNTKNGTCSSGRTTANGLFAFDAGLNALNTSAYTGGVSWNNSNASGNSPFRVTVAPDGRVFLSDWSDSHSGIWIAPQGGITGGFTQLFAGLTRASSGLCTNGSSVAVHGSISGCWVEGVEENTKLYTMDEDYVVNGKTYNLLRYDIGQATSWSVAPSAIEFSNSANNSPLVNNVLNVVSDLHGGWWIIQHRFAETSLEPSLIHVLNGTVDYNTGGEQLLENSKNGGLAVNIDGSRIATTSQSQINIWDVAYDNTGHLTSITPAFEITADDISGLGESSNDVAFDPAGNIYYVSNSTERLVVIGLPKTDNSFTTPARSVYTIPLPSEPPTIDVLVTEWEQSGMTVDFRTAPLATDVVVKIGSLVTSPLPLESLSAHIATGTTTANNTKHITLPEIDLTSYAGHTMMLRWSKAGVVQNQTEVVIPALLSANTNSTPADWTAQTVVVVLPNANVTLDLVSFGGALTINSLEIYPSAKINISGGTLSMTDLILRAGWTTAHNSFDIPKLSISSTGAINKTNAYLDFAIDYAQYYPIAVPFPVSVSGITYRDYPSAAVSQGVIFREYNGEQRASGLKGDNWQTISPSLLSPACGYAITARRPASVNHCYIRMPMNMPDASLYHGETDDVSGVSKNSILLTAYGVGTGMWNDVGWNFIANPYMVAFNAAEETSFSGVLMMQGDGSQIRYATIPTTDFQDYYQVPIDEAALQPMSPFFVQASTTSAVSFSRSHQNPLLASRHSDITSSSNSGTITTDLRLRFAGEGRFDQTYLLLSDAFTDNPDLNADLPKEAGRAPKIWIEKNESQYASLALSDTLQEYHIPLSVQTASEGNYVFSISSLSKVGDFEGIYLTDNGQVVANLINGQFNVQLPAGDIASRFALWLVRPRQITTDSEPIEYDSEAEHKRAIKRLVNQHIEIEVNSRVYDVLGNEIIK